MDAERIAKRVGFLGIVLFAGIVTLGLATEPDDPAGGPSRPAAGTGYSHEVLQQDAQMTEQMSTPSARSGAAVHEDDAQLQRSQDPGYVRALEEHQAGLDQMLARP